MSSAKYKHQRENKIKQLRVQLRRKSWVTGTHFFLSQITLSLVVKNSLTQISLIMFSDVSEQLISHSVFVVS